MSDATVVVGSILGVAIQGREFPVPAGCDAALNLGGYINTVVRFGSGRSGITQAQTAWGCSGLELVISDDRGDLGFLAGVFNAVVAAIAPNVSGFGIAAPPSGPDRIYLKQIVEGAKFVPMVFTLNDGTIWAGAGTPVGAIETSTMKGVARVDFAGDGELVKQ